MTFVFDLPFWSYRFNTSFLLASTAVSTSESPTLQRSLNSLGDSLSNLQTDFYAIPNIAEVVSQPVRAWAAGNIMHITADNDLHKVVSTVFQRDPEVHWDFVKMTITPLENRT